MSPDGACAVRRLELSRMMGSTCVRPVGGRCCDGEGVGEVGRTWLASRKGESCAVSAETRNERQAVLGMDTETWREAQVWKRSTFEVHRRSDGCQVSRRKSDTLRPNIQGGLLRERSGGNGLGYRPCPALRLVIQNSTRKWVAQSNEASCFRPRRCRRGQLSISWVRMPKLDRAGSGHRKLVP